MTREDIDDIINVICPNDEDYEKPCISPKYLRQELEQLALEQRQWNEDSTTKNDLGVDCISRQAVIDMTGLSEWFDSSDSYNEFVFALNELPSVTSQEPMVEIDLYSVIKQKYIEREVLDKIRAEIDTIYKEDMECDGCSDMGMVLEIIDKYKAESEET